MPASECNPYKMLLKEILLLIFLDIKILSFPLSNVLLSYTPDIRPLVPGTVGLLLGHSSLSMKRTIVHTGVIDEDYTGEAA